MAVFNQDADVALLYNSLVGLYDGGAVGSGTLYTFDELLEVELTTVIDHEKYYSATGAKRLKVTGDSSKFKFRVKKTADLYDTAATPTDKKTISYFQYQVMTLRKAVTVGIEAVSQAESVSNKYMRHQANGVIESIVDVRNESTGALEVEISGEIITHVKSQRQSS